MAKKFAPRVSKRLRTKLDLSEKLNRDLLSQIGDSTLLKGAKLEELDLKLIAVKDQVRTKFNDSSIKELAENIRSNGLIQPLVLHYKRGKYTLICGERRYRAMSSIKMKSAPCFILENKTDDELMAIQFSENSSREALHYIDKADGILNYQKTTKASERKITAALGISKSEVHRSLLIAKLPKKIKEAAKNFNIEKYVLLEWDSLPDGAIKKKTKTALINGEITKRAQFKKISKSGELVKAGKKSESIKMPTGMTANALLKLMNTTSKNMKMDKKTKTALNKLLKETRDLVD